MNQENHIIEILALIKEGTATPTQIAELKTLLQNNQELRLSILKQKQIDALLSIALENTEAKSKKIQIITHKIEQANQTKFVKGVETRLIRLRWKRRTLAIAAVAIVSLIANIYFTQPPLVATIEQSNGVHWVTKINKEGSKIKAGQSIHIKKGMLKLDLAKRGTLIIEGPAQLELTQVDRAILHQGRIVMRATELGKGYTIETIQGKIIDIGTEFGVTAGRNGEVETHVIEGRIEAIPNNQEPIVLADNQALRMNTQGSQAITQRYSSTKASLQF